jgi:uncharacterized protein
MTELWLDITDIPATGRDFSFSDPAIWNEPIREYGLPHRFAPGAAPVAEVNVTPQKTGVLVRGRLAGQVITPCDRCAEDAVVVLDSPFELYEELPRQGELSLEISLLRRRGKVLELDVGGILWEQFVLAMPVKPLCSEDCLGLCPGCGRKIGAGSCSCGESDGDLRLAPLRGLRVTKPTN